MTEERKFSIEPVEVEVVTKTTEMKKINATEENLMLDIESGLDFAEELVLGVEVQESILDNKVPQYMLEPVIDEETGAEVYPNVKFNEHFYFHPVSLDGKVILHLCGKFNSTGCNTDVNAPIWLLNAVKRYMAKYDVIWYTKSSSIDRCKHFNAENEAGDI